MAESLYEYLEGPGHEAIDKMAPDFQGKLARFLQENPYGVSIKSGFRDREKQAQLYEQALAKYGSEEEARKWVAPPGHSKHGEGIAGDLSFEDDNARQWAHANAPRYGLHFPLGNEPWHVEPVGSRSGGQASDAPAGVASSNGAGAASLRDLAKLLGFPEDAIKGFVGGDGSAATPQTAPVDAANTDPDMQDHGFHVGAAPEAPAEAGNAGGGIGAALAKLLGGTAQAGGKALADDSKAAAPKPLPMPTPVDDTAQMAQRGPPSLIPGQKPGGAALPQVAAPTNLLAQLGGLLG
jgi:hypothetical protein